MPTDFFGRVTVVFNRYGTSVLRGTDVSFKIALVNTLVGYIIGFAVGIVQTVPNERGDSPVKGTVFWVVKLILNVYVELFCGTPMMVQAVFVYYRLLSMLGINMSMWGAAYFTLSINIGAYMTETVCDEILSTDPDQTEGAKAMSMTHVQTMFYVILLQVLRNIIPQAGNNLIISVKDGYVSSVIGAMELLYKTKVAAGAPCTNFEAYTITMIVYFIITFTCSRILHQWGSRIDGANNYDLATIDILMHTNGICRLPGEEDKKKEDAR